MPDMIPTEVLRKVRRIQIRTSALVNDLFAGQYHSAFRGRGMEFEEVREYQPGDDVRAIDWNVTARAGRPFVKTFREERELTVILLVDISGSQEFGTRGQLKSEVAAELGATLALSATQNNDKVGLVLFSDAIERVVPARKGSRHVLRVIRELLHHRSTGRGTNLAAALEQLDRLLSRRSVVFIISDFLTGDFSQPLRALRRRHDVVPVCIQDPREFVLPPTRFVELLDAETGELRLIDTSSAGFRRRFASQAAQRRTELERSFHRLGLDMIHVEVGQSFVEPLRRFFRNREARR